MKRYISCDSGVVSGSKDYLKFLKEVSVKVNAVQKQIKKSDDLGYRYTHFNVYLPIYNEWIKGAAKIYMDKAKVELQIIQNGTIIKYRTDNPKTAYGRSKDGYLRSFSGGLGSVVTDYIDFCYTLNERPYISKM